MIYSGFRPLIFLFLICLVLYGSVRCWKAMPANQAGFGVRMDPKWGKFDETTGQQFSWGATTVGIGIQVPDEVVYRGTLHSIYRFGYCPQSVTIRQFLRKQINMTLEKFQDTKTRYIYVMAHRHTKNFRKQCVVLRMWVPPKYIFRKGRIPMYYCQGTVIMLQLESIHKMDIHEFYLDEELLLPVAFTFDFYVPLLH